MRRISLLLVILSLLLCAPARPPEHNRVYLPMVMSNPLIGAWLGVQVDAPVVGYEQYIIPHRGYQSAARWMEIEQQPGVYSWPADLDYNFQTFGGHPSIIGVKNVPEWMRIWPDKLGSPPRPDAYPSLVNFIIALIDRYDPAAIELFNEPDVSNTISRELQYWYGAWIDGTDISGAGARYGTMLAYVYPRIKRARPDTLIVAGALIGNDDSLIFLNVALQAGLQADAISFHKYIRPGESYHQPFMFAERLRLYTDLPLILSETALMLEEDNDAGRIAQAEYLNYLRENMPYSNLSYIQWYSQRNDWMFTALLRDGLTPSWEAWRQ